VSNVQIFGKKNINEKTRPIFTTYIYYFWIARYTIVIFLQMQKNRASNNARFFCWTLEIFKLNLKKRNWPSEFTSSRMGQHNYWSVALENSLKQLKQLVYVLNHIFMFVTEKRENFIRKKSGPFYKIFIYSII